MDPTRWAPTSGAVTPVSRVITPDAHLFSATYYKGYSSTYNWYGAHLVDFLLTKNISDTSKQQTGDY